MLAALLMLIVLAIVLGAILSPLLKRAPELLKERVDARNGAALEYRKQFLLREIKDIDMDYLMGKLSDDDYAQLSADYKAQAVAVMKELDALKTRPGEPSPKALPTPPDPQPDGGKPAAAQQPPPTKPALATDTSQGDLLRSGSPPTGGFCPHCGRRGDHPDAIFCAACGEALT